MKVLTHATANSNGAWSHTETVPSLAPGGYTLIAIGQTSAVSQTSAFMVAS